MIEEGAYSEVDSYRSEGDYSDGPAPEDYPEDPDSDLLVLG